MPVSLITGGAGFIGSHLTRALHDIGHDIVVIDDMSGGFRRNVHPKAVLIEENLLEADLDDLFGLFRPDYVWHLAAYAAEGLSHWVREYNVRNNWLASTRLINAAVRSGVERFYFTSSMAVYGSQTPPFTESMRPAPEDPYGIAKYAVEQDLAAAREVFGLDYTIFRPHNVYGPHQNVGDPYRNVVGIFMRQALQGEPLTVFGDGSQTRAFSYISDITRPMVASISKPVSGEVFNVGGEEVTTILHLAELVCELFPGAEIEHVPPRYEVAHAFCDHTKAKKALSFNPLVPFESGLDRMAEWVREAGVEWSQTPTIEVTRELPVFWRAHV